MRDIRAFPWASYLLPGDGRKGRALAEQRRALALQLASYADGDGTRIRLGIQRLCTELGWTKRTLYRRMEDLRNLGLLAEKECLTQEHGTAVRKLDVSKLILPAGVPDTDSQECHIAEQECQIATAGVPDSGAGVPPIRGTQPTSLTATEPPPPPPTQETGGGGYLQKYITTMGTPGKKQRQELEGLATRHGSEVLSRAIEMLLDRGLGNATNPWAVFISGAPGWIEKATQEKLATIQKATEAEIIEANVQRQMREEWERWNRKPMPVCGDGAGPEDYL